MDIDYNNIVFGKKWFEKHNKTLCWFANAPIIKYWFRWLLRIHKDIDWNTKINKITPNSFSYGAKKVGDKIELTTDFRTHEKFGKRLYYGLKPLWYLLHFWDWSTSVEPALNCGFDTLTVYPDAGTGNTTVDGTVYRNVTDESWSSLVSGSGDGYNATSSDYYLIRIVTSSTEDQWLMLYRSIFTFDTSSLGALSTISNAVMSVYGNTKSDDLSIAPNIDVYTSTPTANNNLKASDYSQIGAISQTGSPISYASFNTSGYNNFTFNSTGIGNVSKTGISKFGIRNANYDVANSAPTNWISLKQSRFNVYFADQTGTSNDPKLVITYTAPVTFIPKIIMS